MKTIPWQFCLFCAFAFATACSAANSPLVFPGKDGKLAYTPDAKGNVIPDFSNCGYHGGGVALPDAKTVPVRVTVKPSGGEDGPQIQAAINEVSKLPLDARGIRGAVLLMRGQYHIAGSVTIHHGGVVLRGEGDGDDGTVLIATGTTRRPLINVGGGKAGKGGDDDDAPAAPAQPRGKVAPRNITDDYVPVGAHSFSVDDASGFKPGDHVIVHRPSPENWIHLLGMDQIPPRKNGGVVNQWKAGGKDQLFDRIITAVDGRRITVDAPLTNAFEREFGGGTIFPYAGPERICESAVENLRGVSEYHGDTDEEHAWTFIRLGELEHGYVRNITAEHFANNAVLIDNGAKWVTVQDSACLDPISQITGGRRYSFSMGHCCLCLVQRCHARNGRHDFVMGSTVAGPNVFFDCRAEKTHADIGPHHRWSTGTLWDNIVAPDGEINIRNRGNMGSGHGWAGANQVVWNCVTRSMIIENPPTAQNWAIGCVGKRTGNGTWESYGTPVLPKSLYLAQLQDRLGPQAVANIAKGKP